MNAEQSNAIQATHENESINYYPTDSSIDWRVQKKQ